MQGAFRITHSKSSQFCLGLGVIDGYMVEGAALQLFEPREVSIGLGLLRACLIKRQFKSCQIEFGDQLTLWNASALNRWKFHDLTTHL